MADLDFNSDQKVNVQDLITAIKVFKALELPESAINTYVSKLIKLIYPNIKEE